MSITIRKKTAIRYFLALSMVFLLVACSSQNSENAAAQSGQAAQADVLNFKLKNIDGEIFDMSTLKGKVLIIDFWDTWCPPCRKGIPEFVEMKKRYEGKDFEIVGIAFGRDGFDTVQKFAKDYKMNYTVLVSDNDSIRELFKIFGNIQAIPTAFIIDKNGKIVESMVGYHPIEDFEKKIKPLM